MNQVSGAMPQVDVDLAYQEYGGFVGLPSGVYRKVGATPVPIKYDLFPAIIAKSEFAKYREIIAKEATSAKRIDPVFKSNALGGPLLTGWFFEIEGDGGVVDVHIGQFAIDYFQGSADTLHGLRQQLGMVSAL